MGTAAYIVCCVLLHICAMGTAAYIVCCVLLYVCVMGTAVYIVCCVLPRIVPWVLPPILYDSCCHMFVPWMVV